MRTSLLIGLLCCTLTGCGDDADETTTIPSGPDAGGGGGAQGSGGSGGDGGTTTPEEAGVAPPMLEAGPGEFEPDFQTSDQFFTRTSGRVSGLSVSPHGEVQIWYSKNIEPVIDDAAFGVPPGTVSIKTQDSNGNGEINNIMVMIKLEAGADSERGDWLYQRRSATGDLIDENPGFCKDCHNDWPDTDRLAGMSLMD